MHVTSPFTAPELPLVNITTAICPSFPHSKWEFQKNMVIEREKEKEKREGHHPTAPRSERPQARRPVRLASGKGERSGATGRSTVARGVFKTLAEITYVGAGFRCVAVSVRSTNRLIDVIWPPKHRNMVYLGPYLRFGGSF